VGRITGTVSAGAVCVCAPPAVMIAIGASAGFYALVNSAQLDRPGCSVVAPGLSCCLAVLHLGPVDLAARFAGLAGGAAFSIRSWLSCIGVLVAGGLTYLLTAPMIVVVWTVKPHHLSGFAVSTCPPQFVMLGVL